MTNNTQSGSDTNVTCKDTLTEVETIKIKGTQAELDVLKYVLLKAYYQGKDGEGYSDAQIKQDKQAILGWHNKQVEEAMAKFHLKKGVKYDVKASGSVIVITHTNKLKESDKEANEQL